MQRLQPNQKWRADCRGRRSHSPVVSSALRLGLANFPVPIPIPSDFPQKKKSILYICGTGRPTHTPLPRPSTPSRLVARTARLLSTKLLVKENGIRERGALKQNSESIYCKMTANNCKEKNFNFFFCQKAQHVIWIWERSYKYII